jgi:beta-lactamase superfamily II metal-dependent hydrolase
MYELDVLAVGKEKDADATVLRFTRPDNGRIAHVVVDAGWQPDGDKVVQMLNRYEAPQVDVAIVTHPDGDHIGGMGKVFDNFTVEHLLIHRIDQRGGARLPAADAVRELVAKAEALGTWVTEPTPGLHAFDGALTILGPSDDYYDQLVAQQVQAEGSKALSVASGVREALRAIADRVLESMPVDEVTFYDGPGANPRNNSSVITLLRLDNKRALLTADAGVPAIHAALDYAEAVGLDAIRPDFVQIAHHGSRRNASSELLNRLLGSIGQARAGAAFVNVVSKTDPKHPAGRVVNAYSRRGYPWWWTAGNSLYWSSQDAPPRSDYSPTDPGPPLEEIDDDA